jgi:hypothetical protein
MHNYPHHNFFYLKSISPQNHQHSPPKVLRQKFFGKISSSVRSVRFADNFSGSFFRNAENPAEGEGPHAKYLIRSPAARWIRPNKPTDAAHQS